METAHAGPSTLKNKAFPPLSAIQPPQRLQAEQLVMAPDGTLKEGEGLSLVSQGKRKAEPQESDKFTPANSRRPSRSDSLSQWLPQHDARLRRLVGRAGTSPDWKDIARQMHNNWTTRQCEARFNKLGNRITDAGDDGTETGDETFDGSDAEESNEIPPARPTRRAAWSEAEDKLLRDTVLARRAAGEPVDWASFPKILPGRTESACTKRWHHAFSRTVEGGSGLWTAEEDEILLSNVMERRSRGVRVDWASFPALLPGRSRIAVTQRWHNCLSKQAGVHEAASGAGHWSSENDALLAGVVRRRRSEGLSNDWSAVASHFPGRTALGCQKRWYQHVRAPNERRASAEAGESDDGPDQVEAVEAGATVGVGQKRPPLTNRNSSLSTGASLSSSRAASSALSSATSSFPDTPPSSLGSSVALSAFKPKPNPVSTPSSSTLHALLHHTSADAGVAEILSSFSAASFAHARPPSPLPAVLEPPPSPRQVVARKPSLSRLSLAHLAPGSGPGPGLGDAVRTDFRFFDGEDEDDADGGREREPLAKRVRVGLGEASAARYFAEGEEGRASLPEHLSPFEFGLPGLSR